MNEYHTFSGETGSFEKLSLTEDEVGTISKLGLTPEDLSKLLDSQHFAEGSYALLFDIPDNDPRLVAKVWKNPKHDSDRARNENVVLRLLKVRDFKNASKSKGYLKSSSILFEEKIEGTPVEQFDKNVIEQLAVALANLHSIKFNKYGKPLTERKRGTRMDYLLDGIENLQKISKPFTDQTEAMGLINRSLDKIKDMAHKSNDVFSATNFTLIHFDLNKGNILYSKKDGVPVIVDWEQASAGDNAMDIAKLFLKSNFDTDQKQDFLRMYESCQENQDSHFQERLKVYEPFVLVNSIIWRLGVLRDMPRQMSSDNEGQFYSHVKFNFDKEIEMLKNFVSG